MRKGRVVHTHTYIEREIRVHAYIQMERESSTHALVWLYTYAYTIFCWHMPAGTMCERVELTTQEILAAQVLDSGYSGVER